MKIFLRSKNCNDGFTLIEVIVTLVLVSIFGTMLFSYFGSSITRSSEPITHLKQAYALKQVVENMTAYYLSTMDLDALQAAIGESNDFGTYTVVNNDFIDFDAKGRIIECPCPADNRLRVTVKDGSGITISVLFVTDD